MELEKRCVNKEIRTITDDNGDKYVEGYALVFNSLSDDLGGFREMILPEAINEEFIRGSDIFCYINHNENNGILARSRYGVGSLKLSIDDRGLKYRFKLGKSYHHQQLAEYLERGEIIASSFAFTVQKDEWEKDGDTYIRKIYRFDKIYDVSPVFESAYKATEVALRSKDKLKELQEKEARAKEQQEREQRELNQYFVELKNKYSYD